MVFWTKKPRIGLDLGTYALKCCVLDNKRQFCSIWSESLVPNRETREDKLSGEPLRQRVMEVLKHCEQRSSTWSKQVNMTVEDPGSVGGYLQLPPLSNAEIATAVPSAIAKQIPYGLADVEVYNQRLTTSLDGKPGLALFYVVVPKNVVQERVRLITSLGLEVKVAEPAVFALCRAVARNHGENEEPLAVVEVGHTMTTVVIMLKGQPYFTREFKLGGADFTYAFQMAVQISWDRAEELKHKSDLNSERSYHLEPFLVRWLDEVKRSLDLAARQSEALAPTKVILTGGTAAFKGLTQRLADHLGLPTGMDDWDKMKPAAGAEIDTALIHYDLALGLALHE